MMKYTDKDKSELFEEIFERGDKDELIGLTHSVKYLPKEERSDAYKRLRKLDNEDVNIALIENFDNFDYSQDMDDLKESLAHLEGDKAKEVIAREIRNFPVDTKHELFEELSLYPNANVKKYLARNINQYYKKIWNRGNICKNLAQDSDMYSDIAIINSMSFIGKDTADELYEHFYNKQDMVVTTALARNIEVFENRPELMKKWVDKLLEVEDYRVTRGMAESIPLIDERLRHDAFDKLLNVDDANTKEFLASSITSVPAYYMEDDWVPRLLNNADNSVRESLAANLGSLNEVVKASWAEQILDGADSSVRKMVEKQLQK